MRPTISADVWPREFLRSGRVDDAGFVNPRVDIDDLAAHEIKVGLRFSLGESSCCAQEYAPMK